MLDELQVKNMMNIFMLSLPLLIVSMGPLKVTKRKVTRQQLSTVLVLKRHYASFDYVTMRVGSDIYFCFEIIECSRFLRSFPMTSMATEDVWPYKISMAKYDG
jgi:hypothetical protein